jgi:hypothetical protein
LYKRWQPLYTVIQGSVTPRVEFRQGIPVDLEDDDFFDPSVPNLLVIDDLFAESGKDKRITDLFTEGSHHRSLSVIAINQNLFGNKDPTQRRNCHYLVLFRNPVDCQTIMTLARQMYPGHSDILMNAFTRATKHPYGYLMVDLKPFTPETQRLKAELDWLDESTPQESDHPTGLCENYPSVTTQRSTRGRSIASDAFDNGLFRQLCWCEECGLVFCTDKDLARHRSEGCPLKEMPSCKVCGLVFVNPMELEKHVQRKHNDDSDSEDDAFGLWRKRPGDDDPTEAKKRKISDLWNATVRPKVLEELEDDLSERQKEYRDEGHTERVGMSMAINDYLKEIRESYRRHFINAVTHVLELDEDPLFKDIVRTMQRLMQRSQLDRHTALREAVRLHKTRLNEHAMSQKKDNDLEDSEDDGDPE